MNSQASKLIEKAIRDDDWTGARRLIRAELKRSPTDHWLMTRLSLTYYEQRKYEKALYWDTMALQEAPYCPLATWGYAGALEMLGRFRESLEVFRWLLCWPEEKIANGECGEGLRWARGLVTDCHYRVAGIWERKRQWKRAFSEYQEYLTRRKDGYGSIYSLREAKIRFEQTRAQIRS